MFAGALCCPACLQPLLAAAGGDSPACSACGQGYAFDAGIVDFLPEPAVDRFDPGARAAAQLNAAVQRMGWLPTLRRLAVDEPDLAVKLLDQVQAGWLFHCYEEHASSACLCVGSGWGAANQALSRFYRTVYSLETNREQLRFQAHRAQAEGLANLVFLRCSPLALPITDAAIDLAIVRRFCAEAGANGASHEGDETLTALLGELGRVLQPNGTLCLCLDAGHDASTRQVERNLHDAGFGAVAVYWVWPDLDSPRVMGVPDGQSVKYMAGRFCDLVDDPLRRGALQAGSHLPAQLVARLFPLVAPSALIVASRQPDHATPQQTVLHMLPGANSFVRLTMASRPSRLAHTTFLLLDRDRVAKSVRVQEFQPETGKSSIFIYQATAGVDGRLLRPSGRGDLQAAARWLAAFDQQTCQGAWQFGDLAGEMEQLQLAVRRLPGSAACDALLSDFAEQYLEALRSAQLPLVTEHGDYTPPNILVTAQGSLQVLDWEYSRERGNPLVDVGAFTLSLLRRTSAGGVFQLGPARGPVMTFLGEYWRRLPIPVMFAPAYYVLRWLARIAAAPAEDEAQAILASTTTLPLLRPALQFSQEAQDASLALSKSK